MLLSTVARVHFDLRESRKPNVTIDIDDTLVPSILEIMREALGTGKFPNPENLTAEGIYAKYRHGRIPGWENEHYRRIMLENDCDRTIEAFPGAQETLEKLLDHGIEIACYLTARSELLRDRTQHMLERLGFPKRPVIMRPAEMEYEETHQWKGSILNILQPEVVAHIDDHPDVVTFSREGFRGKFYVFGQSPSDCNTVIGCPTWEDVWKAIQKHHLSR